MDYPLATTTSLSANRPRIIITLPLPFFMHNSNGGGGTALQSVPLPPFSCHTVHLQVTQTNPHTTTDMIDGVVMSTMTYTNMTRLHKQNHFALISLMRRPCLCAAHPPPSGSVSVPSVDRWRWRIAHTGGRCDYIYLFIYVHTDLGWTSEVRWLF